MESDLSFIQDRLQAVNGKKWVLSKFIPFQYGKLTETCPAHRPIFAAMIRNGIGYDYPNDRVRVYYQASVDTSLIPTGKERIRKEEEKTGKEGAGLIELVSYFRDAICILYSRSDKTLSYVEQQDLLEIVKRPGANDELILLSAYKQKEPKYCPQSVTSLLQTWGTTVDKAKQYAKHPATDRKGFDRNKGTANEGRASEYNLSAINARKVRPAVPNDERPKA